MEGNLTGAVPAAEPTEAKIETTEGKDTYTKEEVEELLRQEADRSVNEAMRRAKRQKEAAIKEVEKRKEAEKLAAMSAEQKAQYELEQRERELAEREERLAVAENTAEAVKVLTSKGMSAGLVDLVVASDADTMMERISLLDKEFKASVKAEVEKRLAGTTPRRNLPPDQTIDKAAFRGMSLMQQQEIYRNNPELYKQLTGQ